MSQRTIQNTLEKPDNTPLIELDNIHKHYGGGDRPEVAILKGISLTVQAGEYVAIVGASGSGKSTLMNILGCLDQPSSGSYRFAGKNTSQLDNDQLAWLRREALGFVFQGYHLITSASALENVEMPAIYTGAPAAERHARAAELLNNLGLAKHYNHRPHQLSGGQQQRVSIARALMNGGHIVLADEPTGALDTQSGKGVMALLDTLSAQGHTIILITHDHSVAARAKRIIEIRDGLIVDDNAQNSEQKKQVESNTVKCHQYSALHPDALLNKLTIGSSHNKALLGELIDSIRGAWRTMWRNRFRTFLTLLGIIIGVASVIVMLAIGEGSKRQVLSELASFGANILYLDGRPATPGGPDGVITLDDIAALATLPQIKLIMPTNGEHKTIRFGNKDHYAYVRGNSADFPTLLHWPIAEGRFFTTTEGANAATVAVIGQKIKAKLFKNITDPIGRFILIDNVPFQVIGILSEKGSGGDWDSDNQIVIPYSTASIRLMGSHTAQFVIIAAANTSRLQQTEQAIDALMYRLHNNVRDFGLENNAASIQAEANTRNTLSLMLGATAAISLLVGGIGVMNIMLMTVSERIREIGIRMATGARQRDILQQFLTEALMLSAVGGITGIGLALLIEGILIFKQVPVVFSLPIMLGAFICALLIGAIFGFMPARKAARLDPVIALSGE